MNGVMNVCFPIHSDCLALLALCILVVTMGAEHAL